MSLQLSFECFIPDIYDSVRLQTWPLDFGSFDKAFFQKKNLKKLVFETKQCFEIFSNFSSQLSFYLMDLNYLAEARYFFEYICSVLCLYK